MIYIQDLGLDHLGQEFVLVTLQSTRKSIPRVEIPGPSRTNPNVAPYRPCYHSCSHPHVLKPKKCYFCLRSSGFGNNICPRCKSQFIRTGFVKQRVESDGNFHQRKAKCVQVVWWCASAGPVMPILAVIRPTPHHTTSLQGYIRVQPASHPPPTHTTHHQLQQPTDAKFCRFWSL